MNRQEPPSPTFIAVILFRFAKCKTSNCDGYHSPGIPYSILSYLAEIYLYRVQKMSLRNGQKVGGEGDAERKVNKNIKPPNVETLHVTSLIGCFTIESFTIEYATHP
jgi:hypothetical protein